MIQVHANLDRISRTFQFFTVLFNNKVQNAFYSSQNLSLEKTVIQQKSSSEYKIHNLKRPERYQIKTSGICDWATNYAYNILIYLGKKHLINRE